VTFTPDGTRLIVGGFDRTVRQWDLANPATLPIIVAADVAFQAVVVSPDGGRLLTGARDGGVKVWAVAPLPTSLELPTGAEIATGVDWAGGRLVVGDDSGQLRMYEPDTLKPVGQPDRLGAAVWAVAGRPGWSQVATIDRLGDLRVWDSATGELLVRRADLGNLRAVAYSRDGSRLATSTRDGTVVVWTADTLTPVHTLATGTYNNESVAFSPDGRLLAAGGHARVRLWDVATGAEIRTLTDHNDAIRKVQFSPDSRTIVAGGFGENVIAWDVATGDVALAPSPTSAVFALAYHPSGRLAMAGRDGGIFIWTGLPGVHLLTLSGHSGEVYALAFSPDGRRLASASRDGSVRVWETRTTAAGAELRLAAATVAELFARPLPRRQVVAQVRKAAWLTSSARDLAVSLANHHSETGDPESFRRASRAVTERPGLSTEMYRQANDQALEAWRLAPTDGRNHVARALALYRLGHAGAALAVLAHSGPAMAEPAGLAVAAMSLRSIGIDGSLAVKLLKFRNVMLVNGALPTEGDERLVKEAIRVCESVSVKPAQQQQ
jgi:WD40 repeat protein